MSAFPDLAVSGWTHKLLPHSTWWGRWVRSADRVKVHLSQRSPPGLMPCSGAGGRGPELGPEQEPGVLSWQPTEETAAPRSWTCPNTGWTPPDWAVRDVVRIQNRPESAVVRGTASGKENLKNGLSVKHCCVKHNVPTKIKGAISKIYTVQ